MQEATHEKELMLNILLTRSPDHEFLRYKGATEHPENRKNTKVRTEASIAK